MTTVSVYQRTDGHVVQNNYPGFLLFLGVFIASLPIFWFGLESLRDAWATPEYSHGPLIPIISSYLFLREMRRVPPTTQPITDRWPGFYIILFSVVLATIGNISRIPDIVTYGLIIWIWGFVLLCYGARRGVFFWTAVLHLVFMLPLPNFLYWPLSIQLQFISSEVGVAVIRALGIPVFLDGNIIDLGVYKLQVAEACSGLRYLFPVMSFSYIFAVLYKGPTWHKVVLLLSAAPITVLMNSFRIGMIGVLVNEYGIGQAEGFLHAFEGWVIFGACITILFLMAVAMQRLTPNPMPLADTIDLDFSNINGQIRRALHILPSRALIAAFVMLSLVSLAMYAVPNKPAVFPDRQPFSIVPKYIGEWEGQRQYLDPQIERVLGADDFLTMVYSHPEYDAPVDFFVAYYDKLTEGEGVHSPEVCIPAGGWEMSKIRSDSVDVGLDTGPITMNRAVIQKGYERQLVYYWFEQRGRRITNDFAAKAYAIWDAATTGRFDGGLVRVITPIRANETEARAEERLRAYLSTAMPLLHDYVPD